MGGSQGLGKGAKVGSRRCPYGPAGISAGAEGYSACPKAGLPAHLIPDEITSVSVSADVDAENTLRTAVLDFIDRLRCAERAIAVARRGSNVAEQLDVTPLGVITEQEWLAHWPTAVNDSRGGSKKRKGMR